MRKVGGFFVVCVTLLLAACAPSGEGQSANSVSQSALVESTVPADSPPSFLAEPQDANDIVPEFDVAASGMDPDSIRYQGRKDGMDLFLGVAGTNTVRLITQVVEDPTQLSWGGSVGNRVFGSSHEWESGNGDITVQYVPQGTSQAPDGWSAFSEWLIVRD